MENQIGTYIVETYKTVTYRAYVEVEITEDILRDNGLNLEQAIDREIPSFDDEICWKWESDVYENEYTKVDY